MNFGERYFKDPSSFPTAIKGEAWGDSSVAIAFEGGPYNFHGVNQEQKQFLADRYKDLVCEPAAHGVQATIFKAPADDFLHFDLRGWVLSFDFAYLQHAVKVAGLDTMLVLELSPTLKGALWTPLGSGEEFGGIFENFLRVILAYRLMECGGALIHSAAAADSEGAAFLFVGQSGAGKTTISMLNREAGLTVLHDDLNVLYPSSTGTRLIPVPFSGNAELQAGERRPYPLRAIVRLQKSTTNSIEPLEAGEAIATLLTCSPCVNQDYYRQDLHIAHLQQLLAPVPAYRLSFSREGGFHDLLRAQGQHP